MISGRLLRPLRQNKCLRRASSSRGWNGHKQKSSNRSSRRSSSLSCVPLTSNSNGSSGRSVLRNARHSANAASASRSATTIAPAHPSSGSRRRAAASSRAAFHVHPDRSSACASSGGAGSGKISSGSMSSPDGEVALALERGHLALVVTPLGSLVPQEPLEDVLAERLAHEGRALHLVECDV